MASAFNVVIWIVIASFLVCAIISVSRELLNLTQYLYKLCVIDKCQTVTIECCDSSVVNITSEFIVIDKDAINDIHIDQDNVIIAYEV